MVGIHGSSQNNHTASEGSRAEATRKPTPSSREQYLKLLNKTHALVNNAGRIINLTEQLEEMLSGPSKQITYQDRNGIEQKQGLIRLDLIENLTRRIETSLKRIQETHGLEDVARVLPSDLDSALRLSLGSLQESLAVSRRLGHLDLKLDLDQAYQLSCNFDDQVFKRGSRDVPLWQSINGIEHAVNRARKVIQRAKIKLSDNLQRSDETDVRLELIQEKLKGRKTKVNDDSKKSRLLESIRSALKTTLDFAQSNLSPEEQIIDLGIKDLDLDLLESKLPDIFTTIRAQANKNSQEIKRQIPEFKRQSKDILTSLGMHQENLDFIRGWVTNGAEELDTIDAGVDSSDRPDLIELSLETLKSLEENYPKIEALTGLNDLRTLGTIEQALNSELQEREAGLIYGTKGSETTKAWVNARQVDDKLQALSERFKTLPSQILEAYSFLNSLRNRKGFNAQWRKYMDPSGTTRKIHQVVEPGTNTKKSAPRRFHGKVHARLSDLSILMKNENENPESSISADKVLNDLISIIETRNPELPEGLIRTKDEQKIINSIHQLDEISRMPKALNLQNKFNQVREGLIQALPEGTEIIRKKSSNIIPDEIEDLLSGIQESVVGRRYGSLATKIAHLSRLIEKNRLSKAAITNIFQRATNLHDRIIENIDDLQEPNQVLENSSKLVSYLREALQAQQKTKPKKNQHPGRAANHRPKSSNNRMSPDEYHQWKQTNLISNFTNYLDRVIQATSKKIKQAVKVILPNLKDLLRAISIEPKLAEGALPKLEEAKSNFQQLHEHESHLPRVRQIEDAFSNAIQRIETLAA